MKINQEFSSNAASSANISIGSGHVNGIVIVSDSLDFKITARLRHTNGAEVIIPNLPIKGAVQNICDFMFGAGGFFGHQVAAAIPADATLQNYSLAQTMYRTKIEFGSLFLGNSTELLIDIVGAAAGKLHVLSYSDSKRAAELITWESTKDTNANFTAVQAIFSHVDFDGAPADAAGYAIDYKIKDDSDTSFVGHLLAHVATALTGRYEVSPFQGFALLWLNTDETYDNVSLSISGAMAQNVELVCIRKKSL